MLIGLAGFAGAGKSTVAELLVREHGFQERAFADPLKTGLAAFFGLSREQTHGALKEQTDERWGVSPRYLLQQLGTELLRDRLLEAAPDLAPALGGGTLWVASFRHWYEAKKGANVVVSDVRFQDEVDAIRALGGVVVLVDGVSAQAPMGHVSEKLPLTWPPAEDMVPVWLLWNAILLDRAHPHRLRLRNDGTLTQLRKRVAALVRWCNHDLSRRCARD
jgi:hypothetical protein